MKDFIIALLLIAGFPVKELWQNRAHSPSANDFVLGSDNFLDGCDDCGVVGSELTANKNHVLLISCEGQTEGTAVDAIFRLPSGEATRAVAWCDGKKWTWRYDLKKEKP